MLNLKQQEVCSSECSSASSVGRPCRKGAQLDPEPKRPTPPADKYGCIRALTREMPAAASSACWGAELYYHTSQHLTTSQIPINQHETLLDLTKACTVCMRRIRHGSEKL